jgi:hypothetical protein
MKISVGVRFSFAATFMGAGMHMLIAYMCITGSRNGKHQQQPHRGKIPWHPPSRPLPFYSIPVLPMQHDEKRRHRKSESMDGRGRRRIYKQTSSVGTYAPHTHTWGDHDHGKPFGLSKCGFAFVLLCRGCLGLGKEAHSLTNVR